MKSIYLSWIGFHRRNESLAPLLGAELVYLPNIFKSKWLRPVDYLLKFIKTCSLIIRFRPKRLYLQFPAVYIALPALILRVPYVVDAHNSTWQSFWHDVPLARFLLKKANAVMVHNDEILELARREDPECRYVVVRDPIVDISRDTPRIPGKVFLIASFAEDEPEDVIFECIQRMESEYSFVIPGSLSGTPASIVERLKALSNVTLTGFLSKEDYEQELCSSAVAIVLTTREGCQSCGACEALASNTPLIVSKTELIDALFGHWAQTVSNTANGIIDALQRLPDQAPDLSAQRRAWQEDVDQQLQALNEVSHG